VSPITAGGQSTSARFNVLIAGVGGQGVLTAARFLGEAALMADCGVCVGQMHGMSQRGGSVQATVLIGPGYSSFIQDGDADVVLGLEPVELSRARNKMRATTAVLGNLNPVVPYTLAAQGKSYPEVAGLLRGVRDIAPNVTSLDADALLDGVADRRSLNILMLGALGGLRVLPFDEDLLWRAIERHSPARLVESNRRAFGIGREAVAA